MNSRKLMYLPAGIFIGCILALTVSSMAEDTELDSEPRVFPYNGYLEFNGAPLNGLVDLMFTVTDQGECSFSEEHDNVSVFAGRFVTNIGSVNGDVDGCVFDSEQVYIQVAVRNADEEGDYTALVGQQRIHPVPFAYWAAEGSDMKIDGGATIAGATTIGGPTTINNTLTISGDINDSNGSVVINDGLTVNGAIQPRAGNNAIDWADNVFGGSGDDAWIKYYRDGSGEDTALQIGIDNDGVDNIEFYQQGAVRMNIEGGNVATSGNINVGNNANVSGNLNVSGNVDIVGNVQLDGSLVNTNSNSDVTVNDNLDVNNSLNVDGSAKVDVNFEVDGTTTLDGNVSLSRCRICLFYSGDNLDKRGKACIKMIPGQASILNMRGNDNDDDHLGLAFVCDNGNTEGLDAPSNDNDGDGVWPVADRNIVNF